MREKEYQASRLFKTLGNPLRLKIVRQLETGPSTPKILARHFRKKITNISQHLKILRDADVVWFTRSGRDILYDIKDPAVLKMIDAAEEFSGRRNRGPVRRRKPSRRR